MSAVRRLVLTAVLSAASAAPALAYLPPPQPDQPNPLLPNPAPAQPIRLGVTTFMAQGGGVWVAGVVPGTPAETIGLERGDTILVVNGQFISSHDGLRQSLEAAELNGGHVTMVVRSVSDGNFYQVDADLMVTAAVAAVYAQGGPQGFAAPQAAKKVTAKNVKVKKVTAPKR